MRSVASGASPTRRLSRSSPQVGLPLPEQLEYSFTPTPEGPALGFHHAGRWDIGTVALLSKA
jgi:hypothetical protein